MTLQKTLLTGTILTGVGAYKTIRDYQKAPKEQKLRTLTKNVTALSLASGVVLSTDRFIFRHLNSVNMQKIITNFSKKIIEKPFIQKTINFINPKIKLRALKLEILCDIITNSLKSTALLTLALSSGVFSEIITDKILKTIKPEKVKQINEYEIHNQKLENTFHHFANNKLFNKVANDKNKTLFINTIGVFDAAGIMNNPLDKPLVIVNGVTLADKEKNIKKIFEQTSHGILTEAIIPTAMISIANSLTKNKNKFARFGAILLSFILGNLLGEYLGKRHINVIKIKT